MEAPSEPFERLVAEAELAALEREERELSQLRSRLHEQLDRGHANDVLLAMERRVSAERRALHDRIDLIRAQLR